MSNPGSKSFARAAWVAELQPGNQNTRPVSESLPEIECIPLCELNLDFNIIIIEKDRKWLFNRLDLIFHVPRLDHLDCSHTPQKQETYHHKCEPVQCGTLSAQKHFLRLLIVILSKLCSIRKSSITHLDSCLEKIVS